MKQIMGLTGPTGAGKSTACLAAADKGVRVIDCDGTARLATEDAACLKALADVFGHDILTGDGKLDRAALAAKAFASPERTALLNQTIFPFILEILKRQIEECDGNFVLLDAPTLFESGANELCDTTCAILADETSRLERIKQRDGLTEEQARLRMNAGKPDSYYKARVQHILYNNQGEEELYRQFSALLDQWIGGQI